MFARFTLLSASSLALACCAPITAQETAQEMAPDQIFTPADFSQWQQQCSDAGNGMDSWTAPAPPIRIFGNTFDVGTCGITALLVTSPQGHVLIDSGMPEAAPLVAANIEQLGVDLADVKWLLSSHEHLDHVGATKALQHMTGARTAALARARQPLETGRPRPEDPQAAIIPTFEGFAIDLVLDHGETLQAGSTTFTAHSTPAHTPGSTSWTWRSCEGQNCLTIAYADSLSTPSADDYRFGEHPDYVTQVLAGFDAAANLPCDILLTPHPSASGMIERLTNGALQDQEGCAAYSREAASNFQTRLAEEMESTP